MNMTSAGERDRWIDLLRPTTTDDGFQKKQGAFTTAFEDVAARATPIRDGERFAGGERQASLTWRFDIEWSEALEAVDPTWRVEMDGVQYLIAGVKPVGYRRSIEITAAGRAEKAPAS